MTPEQIAEARRLIAAYVKGKRQQKDRERRAFADAAETGWPKALDEIERLREKHHRYANATEIRMKRLRGALWRIADGNHMGRAGDTPDSIAHKALAETKESKP